MYKIGVLITFLLLVVHQGYAQHKAAPEYLMNQKFPDSVLDLELFTLKKESLSFRKILEQQKGKKVVLDFWASWCPDCIKGLPKLKAVQKKTNSDAVSYVFISVDKDGQRWERAIKKHEIKGVHFRVPSGFKNPLTNYIALDWIPRYVILDEKGMVILPKAIAASNTKFKDILLDKK